MGLASMTGFGRARGRVADHLEAAILIRAVNHRYLDIQLRSNSREEMPEVEQAIRKVVAAQVERGRVTVQLNLVRSAPVPSRVLVDTQLVLNIHQQLSDTALPHEMYASLVLGDLLGLPGVVTVVAEESEFDAAGLESLAAIASGAVQAFDRMRRDEGQRLGTHIRAELDAVETFLDWFADQLPDFREGIRVRLEERLGEILGGDSGLDDTRLTQEVALLVDRSDVAEEVVRLRSHLETFRSRLTARGAVGRALDFLCQEMHRELTTMGSKCREIGVAERLVDAKTAVERIREQVQNLE